MLKYSHEEICHQIDFHWQNLLNIRRVTPFLKDFMVGQTVSPTAPFYSNRGYKATVCFEEPLTIEVIHTINLATHSVNQGFIVRLFAYLKYCQVYTSGIDNDLNGHDEIDILRRLRNHFAHTSGMYDPSNGGQKKLYDRIVSHFNLNQRDYPENDHLFPIPIDTMLEPLVKGCKCYISALPFNGETALNRGGLTPPFYQL